MFSCQCEEPSRSDQTLYRLSMCFPKFRHRVAKEVLVFPMRQGSDTPPPGFHSCGKLDPIVDALITYYQAQKLQQQGGSAAAD